MSWLADPYLTELPHFSPLETFSGENCVFLNGCFLKTANVSFTSFVFLLPQTRLPQLFVEDTPYVQLPQTIFPIPPGRPFRWESDTEAARIQILIVNPEYATGVYQQLEVPDFSFNTRLLPCDFEMNQLLEFFKREVRQERIGNCVVVRTLEQLLFIHLIRTYRDTQSGWNIRKKTIMRQNIRRVIEFMHTAYNQELTLKELAEVANLSPFHFIRVFKQETGLTPFDYLTEIKLSKSLDLVQKAENSITEICYSSGFVNVSHFCRLFKKRYGCSPKTLRKMGEISIGDF